MTCYFPSGSIAIDDAPCNVSQPFSHCCRRGDICLDNHYCLGTDGAFPNILSRASCTDQNFTSEFCPFMCQDVNTGNGVPLTYTRSDAPANLSYYCCNGVNTNDGTCNSATQGNNQPFALPNGRAIFNRTDGTLWQPNTVQISSSQPDVPSAESELPAPAAHSDRHAEAVGAGVGISLGLSLIVAVAALYFQRQSYRKKERLFLKEREEILEILPPVDKLRVERLSLSGPGHEVDATPELDNHHPLNAHELGRAEV